MSKLHVELLTKARERIKAHKHNYLCDALYWVDNHQGSPQFRQLKDHIEELIGYRFGLESWLRDVHGIDADWLSDEVRELRIRWIDWLIEEWRDAP